MLWLLTFERLRDYFLLFQNNPFNDDSVQRQDIQRTVFSNIKVLLMLIHLLHRVKILPFFTPKKTDVIFSVSVHRNGLHTSGISLMSFQVMLNTPRIKSHHISAPYKYSGANTRLRVRGQGKPIWTTAEKAWHTVYSVTHADNISMKSWRKDVRKSI